MCCLTTCFAHQVPLHISIHFTSYTLTSSALADLQDCLFIQQLLPSQAQSCYFVVHKIQN